MPGGQSTSPNSGAVPAAPCHKVLLYGTLKRNQPNHHRLQRGALGYFKYVANGCTEQAYPLVIATRYNIPFLLYAPGSGQKIRGEVYEVDDVLLHWLDEFEGHPQVYERKLITVTALTSNHYNTDGASATPCDKHPDISAAMNDCHIQDHSLPGTTRPSGAESEQHMCWAYFLKEFPAEMLKVPNYSNYDTYGPHDRPYIEDKALAGADSVYDALVEDCRKFNNSVVLPNAKRNDVVR